MFKKPFFKRSLSGKRSAFLFLAFAMLFPLLIAAKKNNKADSLIAVIGSQKHDSIRLKAIEKLCNISIGNEPEIVFKYGKLGLEIATKLNDQKKIANIYSFIGTTFKNQNQLDTSEKCHQVALEVYKRISDQKGISRALNNLGIIEKQRSNYTKALEYYFLSLQPLTREEHKIEMAQTYGNIGVVFKHLKNFPKAEEYIKLSLELYSEAKDSSRMASALHNLGSLYRSLKKYDEAKKTLLLALECNLKGNNKDLQNLSNIYSSLASVCLTEKEYKEGIEYYDKSIEIAIKQKNMGHVAICYGNKAKAYQELKQPEKVKEYLDKEYAIIINMEEPRLLLDYYEDYATYFSSIQDYRSAYKYSLKFKSLNDSLFSGDLSAQISDMEKKLQTEKKQKEIELLKKNESIRSLELKRQKIITYGLGAFMLVIVVLSFFIYKNLREKKKANHLLEIKNSEVNSQKIIIEEKNKDIIDSIKYAERLQKTILPPAKVINDLLNEAYVYFLPKDIVSGDFYWIEKTKAGVLFAAIDCTGHGVPGAMMSIVGNNLLNKIVKERGITEPETILNELVNELFLALRQDTDEIKANDGMDITICHFHPDTLKLEFAGAFNPLIIIRDQELLEFKTDKFSIGKYAYEYKFTYSRQDVQLQKNDMVYLSTDGYPDQFGGNKGKKLMRKNFHVLLKQIAHLDKENQALKLEETFLEWKGNFEQVDDVTVFGFRV